MRFVFVLLLTIVVAIATAGPASAQQDNLPTGRVALVIGNAKYPDSNAPLKDVINDTRELARELRRDGFSVDIGENLSKEAMLTALNRLYGNIKPGSVAMVFFSGYGIQSDRQTYILPVNAQIWNESDVRRDGFSVDAMLNEMNRRGAKVKIAILNASRRNPFERRFHQVSGGLAPVMAPTNSIIMYSAAPGMVTTDTTADQSLFVTKLINGMRTPGLTAEQVFTQTRIDVTTTSGSEQTPWLSSSLTEEFYFNQDLRPDLPSATPSARPTQEARLTEPTDPLRLNLVTDCDRLAASGIDPQRPPGIVGVIPEKIDIVPALSACNDAMRQFPDVARFAFQAGRVANAQGDFLVARRLYEKAASMGNAVSMNNIGALYMGGLGVAKDPVAARQWFEKAVAAGLPYALANIGMLYQDGNGVPKDVAAARKYYEDGIAAGQANAMADLGYLYQTGNGVPQDNAEARRWYEKAAARDNPIAMNALGNLYYAGIGVPKDYSEARKWFDKGASLGNAASVNNLGNLYLYGHGVRQDYDEARKLYEKGAALGQSDAMVNLGYLYQTGNGVTQNYAEARRLYEKSAAAGNPGAMNNLGNIAAAGLGMPRNFSEARRWWEKAASVGNTSAMNNLGNVYLNGYGVDKDIAAARRWFEKAAEIGNLSAKAALEQMDSHRRPETPSPRMRRQR